MWFGEAEDVQCHHECAHGRTLAFVSELSPKEVSKPGNEIWATMQTCELKHKVSSLVTTL